MGEITVNLRFLWAGVSPRDIVFPTFTWYDIPSSFFIFVFPFHTLQIEPPSFQLLGGGGKKPVDIDVMFVAGGVYL